MSKFNLILLNSFREEYKNEEQLLLLSHFDNFDFLCSCIVVKEGPIFDLQF
jgi:hypothetical protein